MESGKITLGVLGGLAAGVLLGILFAPKKGAKTRKKILNKTKDYANELKNKMEEVYKNGVDTYDDLLKGERDTVVKK